MALYRFLPKIATLGTVPPDFGEQLAATLNETRVSQSELARRLAAADGTKSESKRRWIAKLLGTGVEIPEPESVAAIEAALGKPPGYFEVSRREPTARDHRLREVAETVGLEILDRKKLERKVDRLQARVAKLEAQLGADGAEATDPRQGRTSR